MNKQIYPAFFITIAAFGAAQDNSENLINNFKQAVEQVTPETLQQTLSQGAKLPNALKSKMSNQLWLLKFVSDQEANGRINSDNKEHYMDLFPARSQWWNTIKNNDYSAIRDFLISETTRITQEQAAQSAQEEAAAREELKQKELDFERIRDIKLTKQKWLNAIHKYMNARTSDDRETSLKDISSIGTQLYRLDNADFKNLTENYPFYALISELMVHDNIHALRSIKYNLEGISPDVLALIDSTIIPYEDTSSAYNSSAAQGVSNQTLSSSSNNSPLTSSSEPASTSVESTIQMLQHMSDEDIADQLSILPDNALEDLLTSPRLQAYPALQSKMELAILREQERRYATGSSSTPTHAHLLDDPQYSDDEIRFAIEQSLLQDDTDNDDDLRLALELSRTSEDQAQQPSTSNSSQDQNKRERDEISSGDTTDEPEPKHTRR